ncbi:MAG: response regulator transcription factor [Chitinophagales bacterium]|nr:response regulator transcription factor [Chitinophagales bacterium]
MKTINIILADTQFLIREGLKSLLETQQGVTIVAECIEKSDLFLQLRNLQVDIVILDHTHQENFAVSDISLLQIINPDVKILIIADIHEKQIVQQVVGYGVNGFLTKTCDSAEILDAIHCLMQNEKMYCHKVVDILLGFPATESNNCEPAILSDREIEVIRLIANGYTTKEIAEALYRSFHTISTHRKNIMKKLHIKSTSELLVYAMNTGLIQPDTSLQASRN